MGMHSAVSAFERDGRAVTIADLTPGSIFDIDLSGKIVVDSGIVFKIFGVVQVWFKPNPNSEDDFKGVVLALPLGREQGRRHASERHEDLPLPGHAPRHFGRRPPLRSYAAHVGTMEELGHRLQAFVGVEKSGFPSYANEHEYFSEADGSGSFSPLKYKILEYVDWAISE
jgi:hypothetical protein